MTAVQVVGIDLSLTSTGLAEIRWGDPGGGRTHTVCTRRVESNGRADDTLADRQKRLHRLLRSVYDWAGGADLVVIEGPAFSRTTGHMHDRSGLWWMVVDYLTEEFGSLIVEVTPTSRCRYATGKGNAGKDQVLAAAVKRYPDVDVTGNDIADALVLAAMGARHLGHPIDASLPQTHLDAMIKICWPERNSAL